MALDRPLRTALLATAFALGSASTARAQHFTAGLEAGAEVLSWARLTEMGPRFGASLGLRTRFVTPTIGIGVAYVPSDDPAMDLQHVLDGGALLRFPVLQRQRIVLHVDLGGSVLSVRTVAHWIDTNGQPSAMRMDRRGWGLTYGVSGAGRLGAGFSWTAALRRTPGTLDRMYVDGVKEDGYSDNSLTTYRFEGGVAWSR